MFLHLSQRIHSAVGCGPLVTLMNNASHIVSNSKAGEREVSCYVGLRETKVQNGDAARASALITVDCLGTLQFVVQSCELATLCTGLSFSISPKIWFLACAYAKFGTSDLDLTLRTLKFCQRQSHEAVYFHLSKLQA
jgi:hypothetical protein